MVAAKPIPDIRSAIREILHRGLVEIRYLAFAGGHDDQIAKLADVLEFLPAYLTPGRTLNEVDRGIILEQFEQYRDSFPESTFDYLSMLETDR